MAPLQQLLCLAALLSLTVTTTTAKDIRWTTYQPWTTPWYPHTSYTWRPYSTTTSPPPTHCSPPFDRVGDRCVMVIGFVTTTWEEARYYCHTQEAEAVQTDTPQFFYELLNFLRDQGLDEHSYWVGASDMETEGEWRWTVGNGLVPMGSPFWALLYYSSSTYYIEPHGTTDSNCLRMDSTRYLYLDDDQCSNENAIICEKRLRV